MQIRPPRTRRATPLSEGSGGWLAARLDAEPLLEVVEENPFLQTFYQDVRGMAFRTHLATGGGVVADYIFAKDRLFAGLTLDAAELALYDALYDLVAPHVPRPAAVVYLKAALVTLLQRIAVRARPFERYLTPDYLNRLASAYDAFFANFEDAPVITVDTDRLNLQGDAGVAVIADAVIAARGGEIPAAAPVGKGEPPS